MHIALVFLSSLVTAEESFIIEPEFKKVTYGSWIKLAHKDTGYRLHSHDIKYGTGSGQQSVTGFEQGSDPNSYFQVMQALGAKPFVSGAPVACGATIRLKHQYTHMMLHSHYGVVSPISSKQEVSANNSHDLNDNWIIECTGATWDRESPVYFKHVESSMYLTSDKKNKFPRVITGQLEIFGQKAKSSGTIWLAQEGVYISSEFY